MIRKNIKKDGLNNYSTAYFQLGDTMNADISKIRNQMKHKKKKVVHNSNPNVFKFVSKLGITIVITLVTLITLKSNAKYKATFYQYVYDSHISFASINATYQKYFGSPFPFQDLWKDTTKPVFDEKLVFTEQHKYKDGVALNVGSKYLVPVLESGMIIFIGDKEGYGKTVIIQQMDGIDVWYSNLENVNVKLYDYVEKGNLLGEVSGDQLYLVYKKNGNVLNYEEHL